MVAGIDPDPLKAGQLKEWATPYWKGVHPYDLAGAYTNFMMGSASRSVLATIIRD
jgi:hypothetical protein